MKLAKPFYVQRRSITEKYVAVAYKTLAEAESGAARVERPDWAEVRDCTGGPVGVLVCTFYNGSKATPEREPLTDITGCDV